MRIIWSRVSSLNLVCSTDFSLFMQEKSRSQTAILILIVIIISSKTATTLISSSLWQTNSFTHKAIYKKQFIKRENLLCIIRITKN